MCSCVESTKIISQVRLDYRALLYLPFKGFVSKLNLMAGHHVPDILEPL
jgi:hypothetical protein